jgi:SagB-type dehydrogenase family enzyme
MSNLDIATARDYHQTTNHSLRSIRQGPQTLDPTNRPIPYKIYSSLEPIPLPTDLPATPTSALDTLASPDMLTSSEQIPNLQALARLCIYSNGVTKTLKISGRDYPMRAAACTGALFHIELYLLCGNLPNLSAGIYHYGAHDNALRQLRSGDFRRVLVDATTSEPSIAQAPVIAIYTSTFWRNAYKYRARAYRHTFWDDGTILANSLAIASALQMPAKIVLGFIDEQVNELLDIDGEHEAAVNLLTLGHADQTPPGAPSVYPLHLPTVPLSNHEIAYPPIITLQKESSLTTSQEVADWRDQSPLALPNPVLSKQPLIPLEPLSPSELPTDPIETVVRRRGSTRHFTRDPISCAQLSTILTQSLHAIPSDSFNPIGTPLSTLYLIVNAVENLAPGTYVLHQDQLALEQLKSGNFRRQAKFLSLGQDLGGDAAVNIYFLVDLNPVLTRFGNRGYRVAQLESAIIAGKMYLASYALSLGATGLTFFDDDVIAFFSPHSDDKSVMFLIALGHPMKRNNLEC